MSAWWSWALFALSFVIMFATWEVGNGKRWAWAVLTLVNVPWLVYGFLTTQWGFIASSVLYTLVDVRNWIHAKPKECDVSS